MVIIIKWDCYRPDRNATRKRKTMKSNSRLFILSCLSIERWPLCRCRKQHRITGMTCDRWYSYKTISISLFLSRSLIDLFSMNGHSFKQQKTASSRPKHFQYMGTGDRYTNIDNNSNSALSHIFPPLSDFCHSKKRRWSSFASELLILYTLLLDVYFVICWCRSKC